MSRSVDWFMYRQAAKEPSACLMLLPDEAGRKKINQLKRQLKLPEGAEITPDDGTQGPHTTIRYWRTNDHPVDREVFQYLNERLNGESLNVVADEWDILGPPGEEDTLVLLIHSPELMALQEELDAWLQERGVPASDYDEYKPHISVAEGVTEAPARKPNLKLTMSNWSLTEGQGGDSGYDEIWSLRAARWICLSVLDSHRLIAQLRDPENAYDIQDKFRDVLDLARAYVQAKANLASSMRDQRTVGMMRMLLKDIDDTDRLAKEALNSGQASPDLDAKLAITLDLATQALADETIRLPGPIAPDVVRDSVSDFYQLIRQTPRRAEHQSGNSVERLIVRRIDPEIPGVT